MFTAPAVPAPPLEPSSLPSSGHLGSDVVSVGSGPARPARAALDRTLLAAVADGDRRAFVTLYRQFSASVFRMVRSIVRDPAQAEEISQEVFLSLWREAGRFDPSKGTVSGYVSMLAHAKAVDRVRSAQAARTRDEKYIVRNTERGEHHDPVVERTLLHDESVQIRAALGVLTPYQREAVELYYFDRRTYLEVGQLLGVSAAARQGPGARSRPATAQPDDRDEPGVRLRDDDPA